MLFNVVIKQLDRVQRPLGGTKAEKLRKSIQWLFLVPLKGGRDYITPELRQGLEVVYKWYFSCQLGDFIYIYIIPNNPYHLLGDPFQQPLNRVGEVPFGKKTNLPMQFGKTTPINSVRDD